MVENEILLAAGEAERYPASFSRIGSSCQVIGWRLTSSQNKQTDKDLGALMLQIDRSNTAIVGLDLYTVAERHQSGLKD